MHDAAKIEMQGIGGADVCCRLVVPAAWKKHLLMVTRLA